MSQKLYIARPPEFVFKYRETPIEHYSQSKPIVNLIDKVEYPETGGILLHKRGIKFPVKGFVFAEAIYSLDTAKRMLMEFIKCFWFSMAIQMFLRKKFLEKFLTSFVRLTYRFVQQNIMQEHFMTPLSREIQYFMSDFLINLGISEPVANPTAEIIGSIFEYDAAYRFPAEDLFSESSKERFLKHPYFEIYRILTLWTKRETNTNNWNDYKVRVFRYFCLIVFLLPRYRKAFVKSMERVNYQNLCYDEADRYHVLGSQRDYKFLGLTLEERMALKEKEYPGDNPLAFELQTLKVH